MRLPPNRPVHRKPCRPGCPSEASADPLAGSKAAASQAAEAPEPKIGEDVFDLETGFDIVCDSLGVLSSLLGEARHMSVNERELSNMIWLIEEKARTVRSTALKLVHPDRQ